MNKNAINYFLLIILILLLSIFWGEIDISYCGCVNKIVKEIESYNGEFKVIAFIRDCGATTSFSPQVTIIKKGDKIKVDNLVGKVKKISLIETEIETKSGDIIYIPNSTLTKKEITIKKR